MKTFIISMVVLFMTIAGILFYSFYLYGTVSEFEAKIEKISENAYNTDWNRCKKEIDILLSDWEKDEAILSMFNDHEDVDKLELAIRDLKESVSFKNREHTFKSISQIKALLERLRKNETLTLENIL